MIYLYFYFERRFFDYSVRQRTERSVNCGPTTVQHFVSTFMPDRVYSIILVGRHLAETGRTRIVCRKTVATNELDVSIRRSFPAAIRWAGCAEGGRPACNVVFRVHTARFSPHNDRFGHSISCGAPVRHRTVGLEIRFMRRSDAEGTHGGAFQPVQR